MPKNESRYEHLKGAKNPKVKASIEQFNFIRGYFLSWMKDKENQNKLFKPSSFSKEIGVSLEWIKKRNTRYQTLQEMYQKHNSDVSMRQQDVVPPKTKNERLIERNKALKAENEELSLQIKTFHQKRLHEQAIIDIMQDEIKYLKANLAGCQKAKNRILTELKNSKKGLKGTSHKKGKIIELEHKMDGKK